MEDLILSARYRNQGSGRRVVTHVMYWNHGAHRFCARLGFTRSGMVVLRRRLEVRLD
jgi:RimJ/RimL family protein N-acetyltransferase